MARIITVLLALLPLALAKTDLSGCVSTSVIFQQHYASLIWYMPDTGEICDFPDCGGGRAPPKTNQPGCPLYKGTETLTPSFFSGFAKSTSTPGAAVTSGAAVTQNTAASSPTGAASGQGSTTPAPASPSPTSSGATNGTSGGNSGTVPSAARPRAAAGWGVIGLVGVAAAAVAAL